MTNSDLADFFGKGFAHKHCFSYQIILDVKCHKDKMSCLVTG